MAADFWMAKNKVSEPKALLHNWQPPSVPSSFKPGCGGGASGRGGVRFSDRKCRHMKLNQRTCWSHYSVTLRGALSLAPDTNTAPASALSGLYPAHCCSVTRRKGVRGGGGADESARCDITLTLHDAGPPRCRPCWNNHSTRLGWVYDSLTSVSEN